MKMKNKVIYLFLARVWGHWRSHSLLVGIYIGTILFEGNLTISLNSLTHVCMFIPKSLATRMLTAGLFMVMEYVERKLIEKKLEEAFTKI